MIKRTFRKRLLSGFIIGCMASTLVATAVGAVPVDEDDKYEAIVDTSEQGIGDEETVNYTSQGTPTYNITEISKSLEDGQVYIDSAAGFMIEKGTHKVADSISALGAGSSGALKDTSVHFRVDENGEREYYYTDEQAKALQLGVENLPSGIYDADTINVLGDAPGWQSEAVDKFTLDMKYKDGATLSAAKADGSRTLSWKNVALSTSILQWKKGQKLHVDLVMDVGRSGSGGNTATNYPARGATYISGDVYDYNPDGIWTQIPEKQAAARGNTHTFGRVFVPASRYGTVIQSSVQYNSGGKTGDTYYHWCRDTQTETGYKNKNYFKLGEVNLTKAQADDAKLSVTVSITKANYKKAIAWAKAMGITPDGDGNYPMRVILSAPEHYYGSNFAEAGDGHFGQWWKMISTTGSDGQTIIMGEGHRDYESGAMGTSTLGKKCSPPISGKSPTNASQYFQSSVESHVVAYSNVLKLPPETPTEGEVEVKHKGSTAAALTTYSLDLGTDDDWEPFAAGKVVKLSDLSGVSTFAGYHQVSTDPNPAQVTIEADKTKTITVYWAPDPVNVTCKNRFYKGTTLVATTTQGTVSKYAGDVVKGSDWGTTVPAGYESYDYKDCTTITVPTADNTVYRNFVLRTYSITYRPNGTNVTPATNVPDTYYAGDNATLRPATTFKRTAQYGSGDWKLAGWANNNPTATNTVTNACGSALNNIQQNYIFDAVWQPSLKVEWSGGVTGVTAAGKDWGTVSGKHDYFPYNTAISVNNSSVKYSGTNHFKELRINGTKVTDALTKFTAGSLGNLTDGTTVHIVGTDEAMSPEKFVYKHGTTTSIDGALVAAGDTLDYAVTITNDTTVARDVTITDVIDTGLDYNGDASDGGSYNASNRTITWNVTGLAAGASKTVKYTVKVNESKQNATGTDKNRFRVTNQAHTVEHHIPALGETADLPEDSNIVTNYVMPLPEKHLKKTAAASMTMDDYVLVPGDEAVYTIAVTNPHGADAKTFNIVDNIPKGFTPTAASDGGAISGQKVTWSNISVAAGATKVVSVSIKCEDTMQGETLYNDATATVNDSNVSSVTSKKVKNHVMKSPEKTVYLTLDENYESNDDTTNIDKEVINDGVLLTYRIKWQNPTDGKRTIKISDVIPEYARIATAADLDLAVDRISLADKVDYTGGGDFLISDNGTYDEAKKTVNWEFESDSAGNDVKNLKDSGYVEFNVVVLKAAQDKHVLNTAKMTVVSPAGTGEGNPTMESNRVDNPVLKTPDKVAKREDGQDVTDLVVNDGEEITYHITFKNPADEAKDFIVTDIVPEFTQLIPDKISDGGTYDDVDNMITWNLPGIEAGATKTVTFTVLVTEQAQNETVKNTAKVYVDKAKKDTKDNVPTKIFILEDPTKAVLNIDGEDINGVVKRHGDILTYNIVYKNPADSERIATITDPLPANTQFIDATHQGSYDVGNAQFVTDIEGEYAVNYDAATHTVVWNVPTAAKCQEMVTVRVRILPEARDTILRNSASVYIPDATKWTNEVNTPVVDNPVKTATDEKGQNLNDNLVTIGQEITYHITFKNPADEPKIGFITDKLPTGVTYVSAGMSGRYDMNTHTIFWRNIEMAPHEQKEVTVKVKVNEDADSEVIHNEAVYRIDEAQVSTELDDLGGGGSKQYVATKYVLDTKANDINRQVVTEGNTLVYKITYKNVADKERFFTIFDTFPEGTEIVEIGDGGKRISQPLQGLEGYKVSKDRSVAWQFYLGPQEEGYVTATVKVTSAKMGEILKNNAQLMIMEDDPSIPPYILDTNFVENPVIKTPVKTVWNEAGREITDKMVTTGDILTYKITYVNPADETKYADIRDALPNEVKFLSCDYEGFYDSVTHCVKWTNIETAAHERATVSVTVQVKDSAGGKTIQNKGTLKMDLATISTHAKTPESDPDEPDPDPDNPWTKNYVACKKTYDANGNDISGEIVKVGDNVTYRIYFKNTSSKEKNYVVKDVLPEEVDYVSATGEPTIAGKELTWTTSLKSGGEFFYDVVVTVNEKGKGKIIKNHADITESDPDSPEDPYTITTTDVTNPVFDDDDFVKSVMNKKGKDINNKVVKAGDNLYYHITLHNPSENREKFTVTDKLDEHLRFVSATKGATYDEATNTVTWELELDGDAQDELEIVVKVKKSADNTTITNIAHVVTEGTEMDSNEVNNYLMPDPEKSQTVNGKAISNGEEVKANTSLVYTITYSNPTKNGRDITITDKLDPAIVDRVLEISDDGKLADGVITWQIDAAAGESGEVTFTISTPDLDGYEVHNIATVSIDDEGIDGPTTMDTNEVYFVATPDERVPKDTPKENDPTKNPKKNIVKTGDNNKSIFDLLFGK